MKATEATELLQKDLDDPGSVDIRDLNKAQELGIEALKSVKLSRFIFPDVEVGLLPGEDPE